MSDTIRLMIEIASDRSMRHSTLVVNLSMGFYLAKALGAEGLKPSLFNAALLRRLRFLVLRSRRVRTPSESLSHRITLQGLFVFVPLSPGEGTPAPLASGT